MIFVPFSSDQPTGGGGGEGRNQRRRGRDLVIWTAGSCCLLTIIVIVGVVGVMHVYYRFYETGNAVDNSDAAGADDDADDVRAAAASTLNEVPRLDAVDEPSTEVGWRLPVAVAVDQSADGGGNVAWRRRRLLDSAVDGNGRTHFAAAAATVRSMTPDEVLSSLRSASDCEALAHVTDRVYLASGWTKAVYRGVDGRRKEAEADQSGRGVDTTGTAAAASAAAAQHTPPQVAVKVVDVVGHDVRQCIGRRRRDVGNGPTAADAAAAAGCRTLAEQKLLKEAYILKALDNRHVAKVTVHVVVIVDDVIVTSIVVVIVYRRRQYSVIVVIITLCPIISS